jgi:thrombospondin-related uncharacterized protein
VIPVPNHPVLQPLSSELPLNSLSNFSCHAPASPPGCGGPADVEVADAAEPVAAVEVPDPEEPAELPELAGTVDGKPLGALAPADPVDEVVAGEVDPVVALLPCEEPVEPADPAEPAEGAEPLEPAVPLEPGGAHSGST